MASHQLSNAPAQIDIPHEFGITFDLLIVGAPKSATTSLHRYLGQHPAIFMPEAKELAFFVAEPMPTRQRRAIQTYYADVGAGQLVGVSQVNMLYSEDSPGRIYRHNPQARIIAILRNPVERAYVGYWFSRNRGWDSTPTFEMALQRELSGQLTSGYERRGFTYLEHGHYAEQLQRYIDVFGNEQVYVILTEDLAAQPEQTLRRLFAWLGVSTTLEGISYASRHNVATTTRFPRLSALTFHSLAPVRYVLRPLFSEHRRSWIRHRLIMPIKMWNRVPFSRPVMAPATRRYLQAYYREHNTRLEEILARDLSHWT